MDAENNKRHFHLCFWETFATVVLSLGLIYTIFVWTGQPGPSEQQSTNRSHFTRVIPAQSTNEITNEESRIARHFAVDTLPGLMRLGLIKQYKRHPKGTDIFVAGRVWKERSRFFQESLLSEVLVYNKMNGYELETRIIDHRSRQLYAKAISVDRKEFFD